jgi:tumor protein p53-inducible protein 3
MGFTGGKGVDYILDPIGAQNFHQNLKCLALDSKWVIYGFLGGFTVDGTFDIRPLLSKRASLLTTTLRGRPLKYKIDLLNSFEKRCIPAFETGQLKVIIDKEFKMTEITQAM